MADDDDDEYDRYSRLERDAQKILLRADEMHDWLLEQPRYQRYPKGTLHYRALVMALLEACDV